VEFVSQSEIVQAFLQMMRLQTKILKQFIMSALKFKDKMDKLNYLRDLI